ncbi:HEAT repeat domain-containing protein [Tundrisphaera sp. TA3]|uniref:HEAT repeat domain-containing protein n=1 Tax=Tundrisphaera sp. TA3 TaxID=3435775 RepID=UPI003EBE4330
MTERRWIKGAVAGLLAVAIGGAGWAWKGRTPATTAKPAEAASAPTLKTLAEGLKASDPQALALVYRMTEPETGTAQSPIPPAEAKDWVAILDGLRAGYVKSSPVARVTSILATTRILNRFRIDPTPSAWVDALHPSHALLTSGIADGHVEVRATAMTEIAQLWSWLPGLTMTPAEELLLADWKDSFREPSARHLGDRDPRSRAAAVICLGSSPVDGMAALAAPYIEDPENGGVRFHALKTLATRTAILGDEAVLRRLHDAEPGVPELAEIVLKARGLSPDQIMLGKQLYHPKPENRVSIISLVCSRTDIDPVIWLLQLTHDKDETVRTKAAEALAGRMNPDAVERLREMAESDASAAVKAAAGKVVATTLAEATSSLPPLPGSPSLNLKAN